VSNTGRHSFPTVSYLTIFLLFSNTFPTGFFSCCSLVGHSAFAGGGGGGALVSVLVSSFFSGDFIGGGGGASVVISNLFGS
jgi:hypothetical protein